MINNKKAKAIFLFGVCWIIPIAAILTYVHFLMDGIDIPQIIIDGLNVYFYVGLIYLLIDLWRSNLDKSKKMTWTLFSIFLTFLLPYYWYKYLWKISGN